MDNLAIVLGLLALNVMISCLLTPLNGIWACLRAIVHHLEEMQKGGKE